MFVNFVNPITRAPARRSYARPLADHRAMLRRVSAARSCLQKLILEEGMVNDEEMENLPEKAKAQLRLYRSALQKQTQQVREGARVLMGWRCCSPSRQHDADISLARFRLFASRRIMPTSA